MSKVSLADDETPIKVLPATPDWCENYAWAGYDPKSGIGHFFSMGRWLGDLNLWRSITLVALPGGRVLTSKNFGYGTASAASSRELTFTIVEPKKRFRLQFDNPVGCFSTAELLNGFHETKVKKLTFDLEFVSDLPLWDLGGHAGDASEIVGAGHIEQQGVVTGRVRYGDEEFVIHPSLATRDHSRGVRVMAPYKRHCWHNGVFPSGLRFYSYYFETKTSPQAMSKAAIVKDGRMYPATIMPCPWPDRTQALHPFEMAIESELGRMELRGTPQNTMLFSVSDAPYDAHLGWSESYPFDNLLMFEQSTLWEWKGNESGYGHSERGIKK